MLDMGEVYVNTSFSESNLIRDKVQDVNLKERLGTILRLPLAGGY